MSDVTQLHTQDTRSLLSEALLAHLERRDQEAETLYQSVLASDPKLVSGLVWYALLLVEHGKMDEAAAQLDCAIGKDKDQTQERLKTALKLEPGDEAVQSLWNLYETRLHQLPAAREGPVCQHCGATVAPEVKQCPSCSQPVRLCSACAWTISFQTKFCPHCGAPQQ